MNKIKLVDQLEIDQPIKAELKDEALSIVRKDKNGGLKLKVQIDATHSGFITNNRVYPGIHVKAGYKSYLSKELGGTADYSVPILKHHDEKTDAIGRVVGAQFLAYKDGQNFDKDYANPDTEEGGGRGSGVVKVTASIVDLDAIEKIIDARLLSVSSGHSSPYMLCNLCGQDIFGRGSDSEEPCPHIPGKSYEISDGQMRCYAITGPLRYKEISFVNIPAQSPAKVTKFDWDEAKISDSESILIPSKSRGKKSLFTSMSLMDNEMELDLLTAKEKKGNKVFVSLAEGVDKKIDSLFSESSSFKSSSEFEPEDSKKKDAQKVSSPDVEKSDKVSVKSKEGGKDDANGRSSASDDKASDNAVSGLDKTKNNSKEKLMELETLKASLEDMTKKNKDLEDKLKNLTATVEGKESEIKRLNDQMAASRTAIATDLAEIIAHFKTILNKPDTKVLDSEEAKKKYIDSLAKRTVESLKDSLVDLKLEWSAAQSETAKDKGVDLSKDKLTNPALANKLQDGKTSKLGSGDSLNKILDIDGD
jgi:hypothetical protein